MTNQDLIGVIRVVRRTLAKSDINSKQSLHNQLKLAIGMLDDAIHEVDEPHKEKTQWEKIYDDMSPTAITSSHEEM